MCSLPVSACAAAGRACPKDSLLLVVVVLGLVLKVTDVLLLPGRSGHSELLHHFEEFRPIILEQVVGDSKNTSWC
jgi:hypothetical protein